MNEASPVRENIFGKMPGRFDENTARAIDATAYERALAIICGMRADDFARVCKFIDDYRRVHGARKEHSQ